MSNNDDDEQLARRLQQMEYQSVRQSPPSASSPPPSNNAPQHHQHHHQHPSNPSQGSSTMVMHSGQSMVVRLHHVGSKNFIGEYLRAHFKPNNNVVFEMFSHPRRYLRVLPNGKVEFGPSLDDFSTFITEVTSQGTIFLLSKAFVGHTNSSGEPNWHLAMSREGFLLGNGGRNLSSQWTLVADNPESKPPSPPQSSSSASNTAANPNPELDLLLKKGLLPDDVNSLSVEDWMEWIATPAGQAFLKLPTRESAWSMHQNGDLKKILHRPDWPSVADRYQDYKKYGISYNSSLARSVSVDTSLKGFFEGGFMILAQAIPYELWYRASRFSQFWMSHRAKHSHPSPYGGVSLTGACCSDPDILALYYKTSIYHIVQRLIGPSDVAPVVSAEIVFSPPHIAFDFHNVSENPDHRGQSWHIEGFTSTDHSPYTLMLAIALSDFSSQTCGNLCIYPESHIILQDEYKSRAMRKDTSFSMPGFSALKPNLGDPSEVLMKSGDAVLFTQKLASQRSLNMSTDTKAMVLFRISHVDHAAMKIPALDGVWVEFHAFGEAEGKSDSEFSFVERSTIANASMPAPSYSSSSSSSATAAVAAAQPSSSFVSPSFAIENRSASPLLPIHDNDEPPSYGTAVFVEETNPMNSSYRPL